LERWSQSNLCDDEASLNLTVICHLRRRMCTSVQHVPGPAINNHIFSVNKRYETKLIV